VTIRSINITFRYIEQQVAFIITALLFCLWANTHVKILVANYIAWTPFTNLSNSSKISSTPALTSDINGNLHVIWTEQDGSIFTILHKIFNGTTWSENHDIGQGITGSHSIAVDSMGNIHLVYREGGSRPHKGYYRIFDGNSWSDSKEIYGDEFGTNHTDYPALAIDQQNIPHVVWSNAPDISGAAPTVYYSYISGDNWVEPRPISANADSANIIADQLGRVNLVWRNRGDNAVYYRYKTNSNGVDTWTQPYLVWQNAYKPDLAVDSKGNVHIVWETITTNKIFYSQWILEQSENPSWTARTQLSNEGDFTQLPSISVDNKNDVHVIWQEIINGYFDVFYKYRNQSTIWSEEQENISNSAQASIQPQITSDLGGNLHAVWSDATPDTIWDIFYSSKPTEGDGFLERPFLAQSEKPPIANSGFTWPLDSEKSRYIGYTDQDTHCGGLHHAKDFFVAHDDTPEIFPKIYSVADGKVVFSGVQKDDKGYGTYIVIWHILPNGESIYSLYSHLLAGSLRVQEHQEVRRGDWIARQDTSGTGANKIEHLHFELKNFNLPWEQMTDEMKCPQTVEEADKHYYDPLEFIPGHWWEDKTLVETASLATGSLAQEQEVIEDTINIGEISIPKNFLIENAGNALFILSLAFPGSTLELNVYEPSGLLYGSYQANHSPLMITIPDPVIGEWNYSVRAVDVPYDNYPFAMSIGLRDTPLINTDELYDSDPREGYEGDTSPPTTNLLVKPTNPDGLNGWYVNSVEISLEAFDNQDGVGVAETRYRKDYEDNFYLYESPFIVNNDGITRISFRSVDGLGNKEIEKHYQLKIMETTPDAISGGPYFVKEGETIQLVGSSDKSSDDNLSFMWDLDDDAIFEAPGKAIEFVATVFDGPQEKNIRKF
jgi:murein DD-endopeptidase MepM/ murein hydrolase activator NlpD